MSEMTDSEYEDRIAAMEIWTNGFINEFVAKIPNEPPKVVYHYTDVNGLIGLCRSGCMWATHVDRLNDSSENRYGFSFVNDYVTANLRTSSTSLFEQALSEFHTTDTYVACYSTDNDLLGQWRGYMGSNVGYCLGLDTKRMVTLDDRLPLLEPVIYREELARELLNLMIEQVDHFITHSEFGEVEAGYLMGTVKAWLNIFACTFKHPKFEEEREYRHFYQPTRTSTKLQPIFRGGQFGLTPYVEIGFLEEGRLPLESITVGPCQDFNREIDTLNIMLEANGYADVELLKSEIPLRV